MEVKFEDSGTPLKRSKNRKGETSGAAKHKEVGREKKATNH